MRDYALSIDPGIDRTAVAVWDFHPKVWRSLCKPERVLTIPGRGHDWVEKAQHVGQALYAMTTGLGVDALRRTFVEQPGFQESREVGRIAARKGDLVKLAHLVGVLHAMTTLHRGVFTPVEVQQWKGQLPKEVCQRRINGKLFPSHSQYPQWTHHEYDAVGLGLFVKGYFG